MKNQAKATSKYLRLSPIKVNRILGQIRGRKYNEALLILDFMSHRPCTAIKKVLQAAAYNMQKDTRLTNTNMTIQEAFVNKGPTIKRFQPRAQGRAFPIKKPTCHITIRLNYNN